MILMAVAVAFVALGLSIAALISSLTGGNGPQSPTTSSAATAASGQVTIPMVLGMQTAGAEAALAAVGLTFTVTESVSTTTPAGQVVTQTPSAGSQIQRSGSVNLTVSSGP
jgi:serine/threonine-protein kinase